MFVGNMAQGVKGFVSQPIKERFFKKIMPIPWTGCWIWLASANFGYGRIYYNGRNVAAHRLAWEIFNNKKIPQGFSACHKCDTPSCVNPNHIFIGTHRENMLDSIKKGRFKYRFDPKHRGIIHVMDKQKTHCDKGHPYSGENIYIRPCDGRRRCRQCMYRKKEALRESGEEKQND